MPRSMVSSRMNYTPVLDLRDLPNSTVSPFISPSMVSLSVSRAICTASSSSKSSLYLFSKNVFALVALFPIAVAFHGK